jgi:Transposase DDE domain
MYLPEWVLPFKEPRTEIRFINETYYKYQVEYKYNPEKKRTDKNTIRLLGKITQESGFIASDKDTIRQKASLIPKVDIKTFGVYNLFSTLIAEEIASFKTYFGEIVGETVLSFAMMRWAYQSPIKRASNYHTHDFCSEVWLKNHISDKHISNALKHVGENREKLVEWMRTMLNAPQTHSNKFVMMDSTHATSLSEQMHINAKGYNPNHDYDPQVRLMYLFSAHLKQPVYFRLINGNITDSKSMSLCIKEMNIKEVIYIADKGFFSIQNINELKKENLQYIIPLHRNNKLIDFEPLLKANFKSALKTYFIYQERIIWYYQYEKDSMKLVTFLDEKLRIKEESDYLQRIVSKPEEYTIKKFYEKLTSFGTLTQTYSILENFNAEQIYQAYKQRNEVETMFDGYKNFLKADVMYMQDRNVLEGWLAANFIAMIAYYRLFTRLKETKLLNSYSPKDIIEIAKSIYKMKVAGNWCISEITIKTSDLFKKIQIGNLK